jgi:hypothetical protein
MTTTAVEVSMSFEDRMKLRIKEGIGDLLSDEEVKKLIDRGMEEVFLKPQSIPDPRGYSNPTIKPCILHEIVKDALLPIVTQIVKEYIAEHKEEVEATVKTALQNGVGGCMLTAMNSIFQGAMYNFQSQIVQQVQNMPRM